MQGSNQGNIASEVSKGFVGGGEEDPLAFISNNLRVSNNTTPDATIVQPPAVAAGTIATNPTQTVVVKPDAVVEAPKPNDLKANVPPAKEPEKQLEATTDGTDTKKTKDDSIKDLRKMHSEAQKKLTEKEKEVEKLAADLNKYKTGEALPDVVEEYKTKAKDMEKFRDLYDLESSPEYIKTYVEPLENAKKALKPVFEEYGVPFEELDRVLNEGGERKLNGFLTEHFDPVAATDIKNTLNRIKSIKADSIKAREAPRQALSQMLSNSEAAETRVKTERADRIDKTARMGWQKALTKLQETQKYPELTLRGDPKHDAYVKPIMENAAKEFGTVVTWLANNGLTDLPENISEILSTRFALSEAAAVMAESRSQMFGEYNKVIKNAKDTSSYENPPIGGSIRRGGNTTGANSKLPGSPQEAGQMILDQLGIK